MNSMKKNMWACKACVNMFFCGPHNLSSMNLLEKKEKESSCSCSCFVVVLEIIFILYKKEIKLGWKEVTYLILG